MAWLYEGTVIACTTGLMASVVDVEKGDAPLDGVAGTHHAPNARGQGWGGTCAYENFDNHYVHSGGVLGPWVNPGMTRMHPTRQSPLWVQESAVGLHS